MGLNESFGQARSQILLMSLILPVNQAYAMIVSDECQKMTSSRSSIRLSSISGSGVDPLAMYSRTGGGPSAQGFNKFKKNFSVVCDFCKCKGHTKDQCYKLIGYPADFKSKRKAWIIDTGASNHMVSNIYMLTDESIVKIKEPKPVYLPTGEELCTGKVREVGKEDNGLHLLLRNLTQD
ncbi:hypothetical protein KY290_011212 [Solanum tuberosum]|uniref:Uncharacterized protein n=1 Tax=Solanum tuberosum TaxID=4113 RepID=A0ABQ7W226_SOLTU|nr:hypothetical protein KY284_011235 [Solanum tuberosum]KAH0774075.1 hypothetical protein KY290_011212 [Solanum tuberosum]